MRAKGAPTLLLNVMSGNDSGRMKKCLSAYVCLSVCLSVHATINYTATATHGLSLFFLALEWPPLIAATACLRSTLLFSPKENKNGKVHRPRCEGGGYSREKEKKRKASNNKRSVIDWY